MERKQNTKPFIILEAIKAGGATTESLMALVEATNTSQLYGQISYLNTRGIAQAEVDRSKAEFPMKTSEGLYYMGTFEEYEAKKNKTKVKAEVKPTKTITREQAIEFATKRIEKAKNVLAKAEKKSDENLQDDIYTLRKNIAKNTLTLYMSLRDYICSGEYKYEKFTVVN